MLWRTIEKLFETKVWKVLIVLLLAFLIVAIFQLVFVAHQSINLTLINLPNTQANLKKYIDNSYFFGLSAIIIAAFLGVITLISAIRDFRLTKQFRRLGRTMMSFADGNIEARYSVGPSGDVKRLGNAFNHMADSLQGLIEELKESEQKRSEIVLNVAHDLAGPLTAITGYCETIARSLDPLKDSRNLGYIEIIRKNIKTLTHMISELSELSKLDNYERTLQIESISLRVLANDIVSRYAVVAKEKNIEVAINESSSDAVMFADVQLIERVFSNLLENAIHYTRSGGKIDLVFSEDSEWVVGEIKDTGVGIPDENLPFVFERFYRVDRDRSRKSGGSGLGLAIVKKIVDLHGGSVSLTSKEMVGTSIKVCLPKNRPN